MTINDGNCRVRFRNNFVDGSFSFYCDYRYGDEWRCWRAETKGAIKTVSEAHGYAAYLLGETVEMFGKDEVAE